jgi:hypothetical protein
METIREEFKEFVLSEKTVLDLDILIYEFDFDFPNNVENFYYEAFIDKETRRFENGHVRLILEVPVETGEFLLFNALFFNTNI